MQAGGDDVMDECAAAMVLMSLSCSPHSPQWENQNTGMHIVCCQIYTLSLNPHRELHLGTIVIKGCIRFLHHIAHLL